MKNREVARLSAMLESTFDGAAWHGASVMDIVGKIDATTAFRESENIHRISELVQHMIAWREFAIKRLLGDTDYEVSQSENWRSEQNQNAKAWEAIKLSLKNTQRELISALSHVSDERLDDLVENKSYTYYTLLHGVIQHDLYHLGEIAVLAKEIMSTK